MEILIEGGNLNLENNHHNEEKGGFDQITQTERALPDVVGVRMRLRIVANLSWLVEPFSSLRVFPVPQPISTAQIH